MSLEAELLDYAVEGKIVVRAESCEPRSYRCGWILGRTRVRLPAAPLLLMRADP